MNKKIPILIVFLVGTFWLQAQGPVRDRIKTLKVAFITERVGLTSKEAQQFWPIYNEHEDVLENIRRRERAERERAEKAERSVGGDTLKPPTAPASEEVRGRGSGGNAGK